MTNFYNSGLYTQPFYNKISNLVFDEDFLLDTITYNYDVFFKHYSCEMEEVGQTESEVELQMFYLSLKRISGKCLYFKPLIFDADIALECGLTPLVTLISKSIIMPYIAAVITLSMFLYYQAESGKKSR